jgi:rhamnose utilization protein RhaD (predicted bifunctional aldolase and dehydrogenase)
VTNAIQPKLLSSRHEKEFSHLLDLSERIGSDPLLVQASNGNTSIKLGGILWIKASGKLLADATQSEIFVPLNLREIRASIRRQAEITARYALRGDFRPSIETAMHSVLRHRVVIHVHSINAIAWAIREDGAELLKERLAGLHWHWIPYAASGIPLAQEIEKAVANTPETDVFILGNHGLVICGHDCRAAENLLSQVEHRLAIAPRQVPAHDTAMLSMTARFSTWRFPDDDLFHAFGTDPTSLKIAKGGVLYPCQAIFLGQTFPLLPPAASISNFDEELRSETSFISIENCGTMFHEKITAAERATLMGLLQVTLRTEPSARLRFLNRVEVGHVLSQGVYGYKSEMVTEKKSEVPMALSIPVE